MDNLTEFLSEAFERRREHVQLNYVYALLDTDVHIGEEEEREKQKGFVGQERRVAIVPSQAAELITFLKHSAGIELHLNVVAGAGDRASSPNFPGFKDSDYLDAGARKIVPENELPHLQPHPDVVFSLKEPCKQEVAIPGPFLRLGAAHLAGGTNEAVKQMVRARNFAALFDGGSVGRYSYRLTRGDERPIVASMSRFAGPIAGEKLLELRSEQQRVVIFGGGPAGSTAAEYVLNNHPTCQVELYDLDERRLKDIAMSNELGGFEASKRLRLLRSEKEAAKNREKVRGATGLITAAVGDPAARAPKVVKSRDLKLMLNGAAVVDIMIDQGGNIDADQKNADDSEKVRVRTEELLTSLDLKYWSNVHMPSLRAEAASREHGKAMLPYLATLALMTAIEGGPNGATELLLQRERLILDRGDLKAGVLPNEDSVGALCQDLRNGLQLAVNRSGKFAVSDPAIAEAEACEELRRVVWAQN